MLFRLLLILTALLPVLGLADSKKRVLIVGDSISIAYTPHVKEALKDEAEVHHHKGNAGPTMRGIEKIEAYLGDGDWDLIHFNWGLWDLYGWAYAKEERTPETYAANLEKLVGRMKKTGATLVWGTTTPPCPEPERKVKVAVTPETAARFAEAAAAVMERHGIAVTNLHAVIAADHQRYALGPDDVHFNAEGNKALGLAVAQSIRTALKSDPKPATLPNILILYGDDLGYGDLGCYNPESKIPTPNLDALAATGMRFTDGHSSSGICTPSRYALLTGRHHWRDFHGIVGALGGSVFKPERVTLPEILKSAGYHTAAIGKWHLGWDWDAIRNPGPKKNTPDAFDWSKPIPDGPLAHGFDHYFGDTVINFPPYAWIEDDKLVKAPDTIMKTGAWKPIKEGNWECRPGPMSSDWDPYANIPTTTAKGVEFIKKAARSPDPFFLYFAFPSPHAPIIPNDAFDGKSQAGPYGDFVVETDDACGKLIQALDEAGVADNTIVIFSADNGPEKYAYARAAKFGHWSAEPLRGLKRDIYEGGHRVPFIVRWPGITKPGRVSPELVSQVDLLATLAAGLGIELPDKECAEDSHNLLPHLKGAEASGRDTHVHNTKANQYAVREGNWLLIAAKSGYVSGRNKEWEATREYPNDDNQEFELYDLSTDLGQKTNLAAEHPEKVESLDKLLQKIRATPSRGTPGTR